MKHQRHLIPLVQDLHQLLMQVFYFTNVERRRIVVHLRERCYLMRIYQKGDNGLLHRSVDSPPVTQERSRQNSTKLFF